MPWKKVNLLQFLLDHKGPPEADSQGITTSTNKQPSVIKIEADLFRERKDH